MPRREVSQVQVRETDDSQTMGVPHAEQTAPFLKQWAALECS